MSPAEWKNKKVFGVVLSWNSFEDLTACLDSLLDFLPPQNIIVGDNASVDFTPEKLPHDIRFVRFQKNEGYCAGVNRLMEIAWNEGAEFAFCINPDARLAEEDARILFQTINDYQAAVVYPRIVQLDRPDFLDGAFGEITWRHLAVRLHGENRPDSPVWEKIIPVEGGHGACFLTDLMKWRRVGGLNEIFFAYQDEAELGLRLNNEGLRVIYCGTASVLHKIREHNYERIKRKSYFLARNSLLLVRLHGNFLVKIKFSFLLVFSSLFYYLPRSLIGDARARFYLYGYIDALRGDKIRCRHLSL